MNVNSDQMLLDAYEKRELEKRKHEQAAQQRYEHAAVRAHKIRNVGQLVHSIQPLEWDEIRLNSRRHLIADAENVAKNPIITLDELTTMYQERLMAERDIDNPDLKPLSETARVIEELVLKCLKDTLYEDGSDGTKTPATYSFIENT